MDWAKSFPGHVYGILDPEFAKVKGLEFINLYKGWHEAGLKTFQFRAKAKDEAAYIERLKEVPEMFFTEFDWLSNDFVLDKSALEPSYAKRYVGAHLGQSDLAGLDPSVLNERKKAGSLFIGLSTHNETQLSDAAQNENIDYVGLGPVRATSTKENTEPVLEASFLERATGICQKPIVFIGGLSVSDRPWLAELAGGPGGHENWAAGMISGIMRYDLPDLRTS